jgi:peptide deformylase
MAAPDRTRQQELATSPSDEDVEVEPDEDAPPVGELDEETRRRRDAALAHVRQLGDPVLRASAVKVERFDEALESEIKRMGELMVDALGVGLAATQLGVLHRVLVYRVDAEDPITALVNPVIEWRSEELEIAEEGCLSIPGVHVEVERPAQVRARGRDATGAEVLIEAEGLEARVIQHEVDHLDGVLILDRISREARREAMRALREAREGGDEQRDQADEHGGTHGHSESPSENGNGDGDGDRGEQAAARAVEASPALEAEQVRPVAARDASVSG